MKKMRLLTSQAEFTDISIKGELAYGNTQDEILRYTNHHTIDLIICGSHGTSNKADLFIGSNTQRLMRNMTIPVIAVKHTFKLEHLRKVVFASNLDADAEAPFITIKSICDSLNAEVELFYVNTQHHFKSTKEIGELSSRFMSNKKLTHKVNVVNEYDVAQGILSYCKTTHADMAALVNHRKAYAAHYLMGVTETLVFHADFPVLSINIP